MYKQLCQKRPKRNLQAMHVVCVCINTHTHRRPQRSSHTHTHTHTHTRDRETHTHVRETHTDTYTCIHVLPAVHRAALFFLTSCVCVCVCACAHVCVQCVCARAQFLRKKKEKILQKRRHKFPPNPPHQQITHFFVRSTAIIYHKIYNMMYDMII
jgi:hypothetical protein